MISPILARRADAGFWLVIILTGLGTGLGAAALIQLLELVQHRLWGGNGIELLDAGSTAPKSWPILVLAGTGLIATADKRFDEHLARHKMGDG